MLSAKARITPTRRISISLLSQPLDQDVKAQTNDYELTDLTPSTPTYQPQPPSPLLTAAPNSPPFFPFARTASESSFSDLESTINPPAPKPHVQSNPSPPPPTSARPPVPPPARRVPQAAAARNNAERELRTRFLVFGDLENGRLNHPVMHQDPLEFNPLYDLDEEDMLKDMPPGFPYEDWRGWGLLALEYLRAMLPLLLGFMEQDCRWGGARHTI